MVPGSIPGVRIIFHSRLVYRVHVSCALRDELLSVLRDSIVVSISACHADDPGSIPGRGVFCFLACQNFKKSELLKINSKNFPFPDSNRGCHGHNVTS